MKSDDYRPPVVKDLGDLVALTAACSGGGALDETFKGDADPFQFTSPSFGDPEFCSP
jgi:hypothetical protein